MFNRLLPVLFCFAGYCSFSQTNDPLTSSEIFLQIKKLNVLGSVLYVGAHPDDENNTLLPFFAKEKLYRTAYLSLTRGDGGQNLIGDEQGVELGLIRTQELLAARKVDGAEQFFTRAYEFGYSKSAEEALRIWDKEKILSDVVWVIRKFRPDVIIKRFPGDERAGHGHHAASALLADEAFTAAADPNRFPEQLSHDVKPWQAKRILWNTYRFGSFNTISEDQLKFDIGAYNPLLGKSYGELGGEARTMHKSQGEGRPKRKGENFEYFLNTGGPAPADGNLLEGIDISWDRIAPSKCITDSIKKIIAAYKVEDPSASVPALVSLYKIISALPASNWQVEKRNELQTIIMAAAGMFVEATSSQQNVVQGDSLKVDILVNNRSSIPCSLENISIENFDTTINYQLPINQNFTLTHTIPVSQDRNISQPYWLVHPLKGGYFDVDDQEMIGKAENDPAFTATVTVGISGKNFEIKTPVRYRYIDPVKGDTYQPIAVLPFVEVNYQQDNYVSLNSKEVPVSVLIKSNSDASIADVQMKHEVTDHWKVLPDIGKRVGFPVSEEQHISIVVPPANKINISDPVFARASERGHSFSHYTKVISYDHIPVITYFPQATANLLKLDVKTSGKTIGYFPGAGDKIVDALVQLGYAVTYLGETDLTPQRLAEFDAIITGIRAYNLHNYLTHKNNVVNEYVKNGGNFIVQYIKSNYVGNETIKVGPYPFEVSSGSRITEENADVKFLMPAHSVLNFPNKISQKDFEGWVQERSTYQALNLDKHFEMPLAMHDTGEDDSNGSLAIAKYGKGNFVYASLVFFRELPAGVPGAYRLLANIIALPGQK